MPNWLLWIVAFAAWTCLCCMVLEALDRWMLIRRIRALRKMLREESWQ